VDFVFNLLLFLIRRKTNSSSGGVVYLFSGGDKRVGVHGEKSAGFCFPDFPYL
jgi:hypothetical protein